MHKTPKGKLIVSAINLPIIKTDVPPSE